MSPQEAERRSSARLLLRRLPFLEETPFTKNPFQNSSASVSTAAGGLGIIHGVRDSHPALTTQHVISSFRNQLWEPDYPLGWDRKLPGTMGFWAPAGPMLELERLRSAPFPSVSVCALNISHGVQVATKTTELNDAASKGGRR